VIIGINVLENDILNNCPGVLETLLKKNTTKKNIFWATNKYEHLEKSYNFYTQIFPNLITGINVNVIMPRVKKIKSVQETRSIINDFIFRIKVSSYPHKDPFLG